MELVTEVLKKKMAVVSRCLKVKELTTQLCYQLAQDYILGRNLSLVGRVPGLINLDVKLRGFRGILLKINLNIIFKVLCVINTHKSEKGKCELGEGIGEHRASRQVDNPAKQDERSIRNCWS